MRRFLRRGLLRRGLLAILCAAALFSGCLTINPHQDKEPISIGMTMQEVRENFGPPDDVYTKEEGQLWRYVVGLCCYDHAGGPHEVKTELHFNEYNQLERVEDLPGEYIKP